MPPSRVSMPAHVQVLHLEDLGEALEVGVGVRRFGGLFIVDGELWPAQLLAVEYDDGFYVINQEALER